MRPPDGDIKLNIECDNCRGTGFLVGREFSSLTRDVGRFLKSLDPPNPHLSQWYFDAETVARTVSYLAHKGDLERKAIACLMTPTLAVAIGLTKMAKRVALLDFDELVLEAVAKMVPEVEIIPYNLNKEFPEPPDPRYFRRNFNCWIADPPYDEDWVKVTVARATALIDGKKGRVGYLVMPPALIAYPKRLGFPPLSATVLSSLEAAGYYLDDMKEGFLHYQNPPFEVAVLEKRTGVKPTTDWRVSNLLRLKLYRQVYPSIKGMTDLGTSSERENPVRFRSHFIQFTSKHEPPSKYEKPTCHHYDPDEWDHRIDTNPPHYLVFHDVGDWEHPANRHITFDGPVAVYCWKRILDRLSKGKALTPKALSEIAGSISSEFSGSPPKKNIGKDLGDFVASTIKLGLLSKTDKSKSLPAKRLMKKFLR